MTELGELFDRIGKVEQRISAIETDIAWLKRTGWVMAGLMLSVLGVNVFPYIT
jgi:hypothetical protein